MVVPLLGSQELLCIHSMMLFPIQLLPIRLSLIFLIFHNLHSADFPRTLFLVALLPMTLPVSLTS